jgi:tryptophan synthase alpha chain
MIPTRYTQQWAQYQQRGQKAFIPFTLLGWPSFEHSYRQLAAMVAAGVFALEVGLPFSDPVADGPIIQRAVFDALNAGFNLNQAWPWLAKVRQLDAHIPIGLLVYNNMVQAVGVERFCQQAKASGVDGVLIADLPPEMAEPWVTAAKAAELDTIFTVSSLTTPDRLRHIGQLASGFLYGVSRLGITGVESRYETDLTTLITHCHTACDLPVFMGFGISTPDHARQMTDAGADGYITGSRIIQLVQDHADKPADAILTPFLNDMIAAGCRTITSPHYR